MMIVVSKDNLFTCPAPPQSTAQIRVIFAFVGCRHLPRAIAALSSLAEALLLLWDARGRCYDPSRKALALGYICT
jgi:hypothetical protein